MSEYSFEISTLDVSVALDCEADRAKREGFTLVEERQRKTALHLRNAETHMGKIVPEGHRVRTRIVVDFVPDVRATLRDDVREGRFPDTGKAVPDSGVRIGDGRAYDRDKAGRRSPSRPGQEHCVVPCDETCPAGRS